MKLQLELCNVRKEYDNTRDAILKELNLSIYQGEFVCVVGKSGCGKSTLLNLIAGLEKPTSGRILLNGKQIEGPGADRVVMFQEHALFPWLSVRENVCFGMNLKGMERKHQLEKCRKYLRMVGLWDYRRYYVHELSGGMRQRVALARALTMDSEVLLMDEPFSALDKQTSNHLRKELQEIWMETQKTILFITHSVEEAVYLGDRVIIMSPETKGVCGEVAIDLKRPRHVYDETFTEYRHRILNVVQSGL